MEKPQIIAEIGQNWQGKLTLVTRMITGAKDYGADLVKFQLYDTDKLYKPTDRWYEHSKKCELDFREAKALFDYATDEGIECFFSVFDTERVKWCEEIGVKRYKLACGFVHPKSGQNMDVMDAVLDTKKPVIVSYSRVPDGINFFKFIMLYCVPKYPAPLADIHFGNMFYDEDMDGFSDHTIGIEAAMVAMARGAKIIEKHFTFDKNADGPDHIMSMDCNDLKRLSEFRDVVCQIP